MPGHAAAGHEGRPHRQVAILRVFGRDGPATCAPAVPLLAFPPASKGVTTMSTPLLGTLVVLAVMIVTVVVAYFG